VLVLLGSRLRVIALLFQDNASIISIVRLSLRDSCLRPQHAGLSTAQTFWQTKRFAHQQVAQKKYGTDYKRRLFEVLNIGLFVQLLLNFLLYTTLYCIYV